MNKANTVRILLLTISLSVLAFLSSCGGGGGIAGIDGSGSKPQTSVSGPINGFGSVIVNGTRFNTDDAQIYVGGVLSDEHELDVGDYVTVIGGTNEQGEPVAQKVYYQPRLTGTVEWVDIEKRQFQILQQVIQVSENTVYSDTVFPATIEGISEGQRITVSGSSSTDYVIQASRVELSLNFETELSGVVEKLNALDKTFELGGLTINYVDVNDISPLRNNIYVTVTGDYAIGDSLHATRISYTMDFRQIQNIPSNQISGYVTNFNENTFKIDNVPVQIFPSTTILNGDIEDIDNNTELRVVGRFSYEILLAEEIHIVPEANLQTSGIISDVEVSTGPNGKIGSFTANGITYVVKTDTRLPDFLGKRVSINDLRANHVANISAYAQNGKLYATVVALISQDAHWKEETVRGPVAYVFSFDSSINILNRAIRVDGQPMIRVGDKYITKDVLFSHLMPWTELEVIGINSVSFVQAQQIKILSNEDMFLPYAFSWPAFPAFP